MNAKNKSNEIDELSKTKITQEEIIQESIQEENNHQKNNQEILAPLIYVSLPWKKKETKQDPYEISCLLNKSVPGNEKGKKELAIAIYKNTITSKHFEFSGQKENIILSGPQGVGKFSLVQKIGEAFHLPVLRVSIDELINEERINNKSPTSINEYLTNKIFSGISIPSTLEKLNKKESAFLQNYLLNLSKNSANQKIQLNFFHTTENADKAIIYLDKGDSILYLSIFDSIIQSLCSKLADYMNNDIYLTEQLTTQKLTWILSGNFDLKSSEPKATGFRANIIDKKVATKSKAQFAYFNPDFYKTFNTIIDMDSLQEADFEEIFKEETSTWSREKTIFQKHFKSDLNITEDAMKIVASYLHKTGDNLYAVKPAIQKMLETYYLSPSKFSNKKITIDAEHVSSIFK